MENTTANPQVDTPNQKLLYTAKTHTTGGREGGMSRSSDGNLDVRISPPGKDNGTNPEQLFASGWSTCFFSAMKIAAAKMKVRFPADAFVDAEVDLLLAGSDDFSLRARLNVSLPGIDPKVAQAIAEAAHKLCPYSKATHGNVEVETNIL
ncbi:MAG TPA: organic hydroperoxide resistance protein [Puia sp.]